MKPALHTLTRRSQETVLLQAVFSTVYNHRIGFSVSLGMSLVLGILYLRYATPVYRITASVMIKDDSRGTYLADIAVPDGMGLDFGPSSTDDEIEILKSRWLMETVVGSLQLYTRYFVTGRLKTTELYSQTPALLRFVTRAASSDNPEEYALDFPNGSTFRLSTAGKTWQGNFGDTLLLPSGSAVLTATGLPASPDNHYHITVYPNAPSVENYQRKLSVAAAKKGNLIQLALPDPLPDRGEAFLNQLIAHYLQADLNAKNRIADSTIAFINSNLIKVSRELAALETTIQHYRTTHQITAISEQTRLLLQQDHTAALTASETEVRWKLVGLLEAFLQENPHHLLPASLLLNDAPLTELTHSYQALQLQREKRLSEVTGQHPSIIILDNQLLTIREALLAALHSMRLGLQLRLEESERLAHNTTAQLAAIPANERIYLGYFRRQEVQQELYLLLLKKKMETALSKSSTIANARIIDPPKAATLPLKPNRELALAGSLLLGLLAPALFLYVKDLLHTTVAGKYELQNTLSIPIWGEVAWKPLPAPPQPLLLTEQFRMLRIRLYLLPLRPPDQILLITSTTTGEGKSFIARYLSLAFARAAKKVLLIECDLRRPTLAHYLNLPEKGLLQYLTSENRPPSITSPEPGFDVLCAGGTSSSPAELLIQPRFEILLTTLRRSYDYIILDTPPITAVEETYAILHHAQLVLYVIRQGYTSREQLGFIQDLHDAIRNARMGLVLNGINHTIPANRYAYPEKSGS